MTTYRSSQASGASGVNVLGIGLISAAVTMGFVAYAGRLDDGPGAIEAGHRCDRLDCDLCEANRQWLRENPGRRLDDIRNAAVHEWPVRISFPAEAERAGWPSTQ